MSRIPLAEPETLPPYLRKMHDEARPDDWSTRNCARAFAAHPDLLEQYLGFYYPYHSNDGVEGKLDPRLKELVRLRIATLNGCKSCKAARLAPGKVTEHEAIVGVDQRDKGPFSAQERAAIGLAEAMALTHHDIDDDAFRRAKEHFSDAELLELMMMAGQYIGLGRMLAILQLETVTCPI